MQQFATSHHLRNEIVSLLASGGIADDTFTEMLDYTIELFETKGLGVDYYGYHNIDHELEVTYVTLLSGLWNNSLNEITKDDLRYLFAASLFHDFDPQKSVDKPHEENVLKFISTDPKLKALLDAANLDIEIVKALILRTTFPWAGTLKENALRQIEECLAKSSLTRNNNLKHDQILRLGWFLSVVDRVSGYTLGNFVRGMEMAKMNAHALGWQPTLIVRSSVAYFETLINNETEMCERVLKSLPKHMKENFFNNVLSFMRLRQEEIQIQAECVYEKLRLFPLIDKMSTRQDSDFIKKLFAIYEELPRPLQFAKDRFEESVKDPNIILNTLRIGNVDGEIVGFVKGGPLEGYELRPEIKDGNFGKYNTIFLEPIALKMGYWGLGGGSEMRHLFTMQAHARKYEYLTSYAHRDVIKARIERQENIEFVKKFDPERFDYYRIKL